MGQGHGTQNFIDLPKDNFNNASLEDIGKQSVKIVNDEFPIPINRFLEDIGNKLVEMVNDEFKKYASFGGVPEEVMSLLKHT